MQSKFNKQTNKLHRGENLNKMLEIIKVGIHRGKLGTNSYWMGISMGGFSLFQFQQCQLKNYYLFLVLTQPFTVTIDVALGLWIRIQLGFG
jgi:hypothetical protein